MITQMDVIGVLAILICPPVIIFVYLLAWGLCQAAKRGEEQGEREWLEWLSKQDD